MFPIILSIILSILAYIIGFKFGRSVGFSDGSVFMFTEVVKSLMKNKGYRKQDVDELANSILNENSN